MVLKTDIRTECLIKTALLFENREIEFMYFMFNIRTVLYTVHGSEDRHTDRVSYKNSSAVLESKNECIFYKFNIRTVLYTVQCTCF